MKILKLLLVFLSMSALGQDDCADSLKNLIGDSPGHKKVLSEYLNLQAGITLHKLAYAAYRSSGRSEEFRMEQKILELLEERRNRGESSHEFKKVMELFKDPNNSVSRSALAKALPYIQDILNDQRNEQSEFERKMFNLGPADIKMTALLAERETFIQGRYGSKFYKSRDSDLSILNFTKIINSSIRNFSVIDPERIKKRITTLQQRAVELLNKLDISLECKKLVGNCVLKRDETQTLSPDFSNSLLAISQEIEFPDRFERLRYNDVWLYAGKKSSKGRSTPIKKEKDRGDKKQVALSENLSISHEEALANYYADRALAAAPLLFSRKELIANPEFSRSLVKAMDEGLLDKRGKERVFAFNGGLYHFPELWNWESREKSGGKLDWAWSKAMETKDKIERWWPVAKTRKFVQKLGIETLEAVGLEIESKFPQIKKEDLPDFLSTWNRQQSGYGHEFSFLFKNKIYDIKTGKELQRGIGPFLTKFKTGKKATAKPSPLDHEKANELAAAEVLKGNESFIFNGAAYHLSGANINIERAYERAKKRRDELAIKREEFPSFETVQKLRGHPEALKVIADGKRAYLKGGKAYDLFKGAALTSFEASKAVAQNRKRQGVQRSPSDYMGMGQKYIAANAVASLNHEPTFTLDHKTYQTNTGRSIASGLSNSAVAGLINKDAQNDKYEALSLSPKELIAAFEKDHGACEVYGVLDKSSARIKVLNSKSSRKIFSSEVLLGKRPGDEKTQYFGGLEGPVSNNSTAAGVFLLGHLDAHRGFANSGDRPGLAFGKVDLERSNLLYDGDISNNFATKGAVLMEESDYESLRKALPRDCALYSMPQSEEVSFMVRDDNVLLMSQKAKGGRYNVNRPKTRPPKEIKLKLTEEVQINQQTKEFLNSLESNKPRIMSDLGLSNHEYNELAKLAFGIMGVESQFGDGLEVFPDGFSFKNFLNPRRHKEKSYGGVMVFIGKLFSRGEISIDSDSRSRGLTQIKAVEDFPHIKRFGGITKDNLMEPSRAAIATMYALGEMYSQLERTKALHSGITEFNKIEYLYYIYNGQIQQIKESNATPQLNARARKVMQYAELLDVYER